jgi:uncharacterized oxidoreductase
VNIKGNIVLITGGATGIGLSMVKEFLNAGNEVLICGRRKDKLDEAKSLFPQIHVRQFDVASEKDREDLFTWVEKDFPELNILVNNAGIQRTIDFRNGSDSALVVENEIAINFEAPVFLCSYFIPFLMKKKEAAIINVTSGLGFIPIAAMPVYCATKAAMHSFSISLRRQLRDTNVKVFELIPPTVDTDLDKGERKKRGQTNFGISPDEAAKEVFAALRDDKFEYAIGEAKNLKNGLKQNPEEIFERMNKFFK